MSVPTMAWTVLLLGLLAYGSGQEKGLYIFGGQIKGRSEADHISPVVFRGEFSECGDPGAIAVSVSRRDGHTHLWP